MNRIGAEDVREVMTISITIVGLIILGFTIWYGLTHEAEGAWQMALGALISMMTQAMNHYFGNKRSENGDKPAMKPLNAPAAAGKGAVIILAILIGASAVNAQAADTSWVEASYNQADNGEARPVVDVEVPAPLLAGGGDTLSAYVDYTFKGMWLPYEPDAPFVEYRHLPGVSLGYHDDDWGGWLDEVLLGYLHESTGNHQEHPDESRSWNRLFAQLDWNWYLNPDHLMHVQVKPWYVINVESRSNPDIRKYCGDASLMVEHFGRYNIGLFSFDGHSFVEVAFSEQMPQMVAWGQGVVEARIPINSEWPFYFRAEVYRGYGYLITEYEEFTPWKFMYGLKVMPTNWRL